MNQVSIEDINGERHMIDLNTCVLEHLKDTMLGLVDRGYYMEFEVFRVCYTGGVVALISQAVYIDLRSRLKDGRVDIMKQQTSS